MSQKYIVITGSKASDVTNLSPPPHVFQPKLYAGELLDLVASHFNLKEKEYFGLSFKDET